MPTLKTKLTPFWYEPEFQEGDKVKFRLRPLTQRDMIELDEFADEAGNLPRRAQYEAGVKAITAVQGFTDEDGNELSWSACSDLIDRYLITQCGFRAIVAQNGGDWDAIASRIRDFVNGVNPAPASADGQEKN